MDSGDHRPEALQTAQRIADEVLFPAAKTVEETGILPIGQLDLLAEHGFYGLAAPEDLATVDLPDFAAVLRLIEILAGGCLTTAFVWIQHHGLVRAVAASDNAAVRDTYLGELIAGRSRAGLAIGAALRPGPTPIRAERVDGGYVFDGTAPWVTGWDRIDLLYAAARDVDDVIVWAALDAAEGETITVEPLQMLAVQASNTVTIRFDRHFVPNDRVIATKPFAEHLSGDTASLRFNGPLALGVAGRATTLLGEDAGGLVAELDRVRGRLSTVEDGDVPEVRAATSELAMRAASAYAVAHGSRSMLPDAHAGRLIREATFLLVFGSRPAIRSALLARLTG